MKFTRMLATAVITACFAATTAFASPDVAGSTNAAGLKQETSVVKPENKDPLKMMQNKKEKVQQMLKEGKITKEEADAINKKIDLKIKEVQEFNTLPLNQKKEKLNSKFKDAIEKKVAEGKLDRTKADELIKKHMEKVQNWDGNGYPGFFKKRCNGCKGDKKRLIDNKD